MAGVEADGHVLAVELVGPPADAGRRSSASAPSASGSIASAIRVSAQLVGDADDVRACTAPRRRRRRSTAPYDSGFVEIVPSTPSGSSAREDLREPQRVGDALLRCASPARARRPSPAAPWNVPCGKPLIVNTYRPSASSQARKRASRSPSSSSALSAPDSRRPMPNGASGDSRAFSAGACARRTVQHGLPADGGVDVRAVGEMKVVADPHYTATAPSRSGSWNFGDWPRNSIGFS